MDLFQFLKARVSILDVVGEYVALKRAGTYYKGNCPIHAERTPSFTVSPHRGIYYCFGCHKGGDAIAFITEVERCTAREAALSLAERYGIDLPEELINRATPTQTHSEREHYFSVCAAFSRFCQESLTKNAAAREYCVQRGVSQKTIERFSLGYFPGGERGIQALLKHVREDGILAADLIAAQILKEGAHGLFSPFEERIIFPIENNLGNTCGFGGRIFLPGDTRPKYTNSQDHPLFTKGTLLYGMAQNKKSIHAARVAHLVEGYLDCILMAEAGITTAVATLGTACSEQHLIQLARHAETIIVTYDGDPAGRSAIMRLAKLCWQIESDLRVALLPTGDDPASLVARGVDIRPFLTATQSIWQFAIAYTAASHTNGLKDQLAAIRELLENISKLNDPLKEQMLILEASRALGIPADELTRSIGPRHTGAAVALPQSKNVQNEISDFEKVLLYAILAGWDTISDDIKTLMISALPQGLVPLVTRYGVWRTEHPEADMILFMEHVGDAERQVLSATYLRGEERGISVDECIDEFLKKQWKMMVKRVKMSLTRAESKPDQTTQSDFLVTFETIRRVMHRRGLI